MKRMKRLAAAGAICAAMPGVATSGDWPGKPMTVIVPYGPGGGVDVFTRPLAAGLSKELGQPMIVENRPGAGGIIGVQHVSKANPDGYTYLSGGVHQPMAEGLYPKRNYDLDKDFVPVALTAYVPTVLVVTNNAPYKTVREFVAYAKAHPGDINYCSSGNGTSQHLVGEQFKRLTGINVTHVPYRGTAAAMTDLIAGHCSLMFDGLGTSASQIRSGSIRPLAVVTKNRSTLFPDIPTLKEAGGPDMDATIWYGWWTRQGTPPAVVKRMAEAIRNTLKDPAVAETWKLQGAEVPTMPYAETGPYVHAEIERWTQAVKELGISVD
ncbi:Bug family tripartite tricarboxylate transporter substrate binding protein [Achromobacter denitrificans]|uniref:Bug family tripartite tricarboxylate transporter substrate binding protein n=1 Tax=Achromobacter denitrificans TaxID=32002 RepID=UPI000B493B02|nr:tripartite tricarboxylate transporter substrate binding protein [Achromobacter denitrificans]